jgi:hypothetical protein
MHMHAPARTCIARPTVCAKAWPCALGARSPASHQRPSTSSLRPLRQRQPRREHRHGPRIPRCRPAGRRSTAAVGYRAGRATRTALPMPALRRLHDRDRAVRTRLRAEVAADPERVRHLMSHMSFARRLPVRLRPPDAGHDRSRPDSWQSMRPPPARTLQQPAETLFSLSSVRVQACRSPCSRLAPPSNRPAHQIAIALAAQPAANLPATSCLDAFWTPGRLRMRQVSVLPASKNLHKSGCSAAVAGARSDGSTARSDSDP